MSETGPETSLPLNRQHVPEDLIEPETLDNASAGLRYDNDMEPGVRDLSDHADKSDREAETTPTGENDNRDRRVRVATHSGRIAFEPDRLTDDRFRAVGRLSQIVGPVEAEEIVQRILRNRRELARLYIRMNNSRERRPRP